MHSERRCIRCKEILTHKNNSREHIVPRAIGGRKEVKGVLCKKCNEIKGREWDTPLAEQTRFLFTYFNGTRQKKPTRGIVRESIDGTKIRLLDSGEMTIAETVCELVNIDGKKCINLQAPSEEEAKNALKKLQKEHPDITINIEEMLTHAKYTSTPFEGVFKESLSFGGQEQGKSIVCSCLTLATLKRINPHQCHNAMEYLFQNGIPCFGYYYTDKDPIINRPTDSILHCVSIKGSATEKTLIGYVEYFSVHRMLVLLDDNFTGQDIEATYCININTKSEIGVTIEFPTDVATVRQSFDYTFFDTSIIKNVFGKTLEFIQRKQRNNHTDKWIDDIISSGIESCGAKEKGYFGEEEISKLTQHIFDEIPPYIRKTP